MKKIKIFITGAYGLLGTSLCNTIDKKKYKIYRHGKKKNREEYQHYWAPSKAIR